MATGLPARTTRVHTGDRRAVSGRTSVRGVRSPQAPAWPSTPARPRVPDTSRPEGGRSESSGRSIRRSLVTTFSTFLKAGPAGGPPAAAVLAPAATRRAPARRPHRPQPVHTQQSPARRSVLQPQFPVFAVVGCCLGGCSIAPGVSQLVCFRRYCSYGATFRQHVRVAFRACPPKYVR
jgi:hypothetical protein